MQPGLPGVIEHEREADDRCRLAQPGLELGCETPPARARDLEERLRPRRANDTGRACVEQCGRAAVERRLGGADRDDEVGVDERRMRPQHAAADRHGAEVVGLAVVHDDPAAEVTRAIGAQQSLEVAAARPPAETGGDEHRDRVGSDPTLRERVQHRRECVASRILLDRRQRQDRRLHDDGRAAARAAATLAERRPGERIAERLDDGRRDVGERLERRRGGEQHRVVGQRDERQPRARVERDTKHCASS